MYQSLPERLYPPTWRVIVAFVVVPGLTAFVVALWMPLYAGLPSFAERVWRSTIMYSLFGAYPATTVLGIPAYFMLRRHFAPKLANCSLVGAAIAALPWAFLSVASAPDQASIDGRATVINGARTIYGWLTATQFIGQVALFGALGGALFWAIATAGSGAGKVRSQD